MPEGDQALHPYGDRERGLHQHVDPTFRVERVSTKPSTRATPSAKAPRRASEAGPTRAEGSSSIRRHDRTEIRSIPDFSLDFRLERLNSHGCRRCPSRFRPRRLPTSAVGMGLPASACWEACSARTSRRAVTSTCWSSSSRAGRLDSSASRGCSSSSRGSSAGRPISGRARNRIGFTVAGDHAGRRGRRPRDPLHRAAGRRMRSPPRNSRTSRNRH